MNTYNPNTRYDHGEFTAAPGLLPNGTTVKFPDGDQGTVVQGSTLGRHLISRSRSYSVHGASETRDWFDLNEFPGTLVSATETKNA